MNVIECDQYVADARRLSLRDTSPLSEDHVRAIRAAEGSLSQLVSAFGINKTSISRIRRRERYAWVPDDPADTIQEPYLIDVGAPMRDLSPAEAALVLQVDAHAFYCGDCVVTDLHGDRPAVKFEYFKVAVSRVLCSIRFDLPLWQHWRWHTRHICGNEACVNPHHLIPGTPQENSDDMVRHGRAARGERHGGARLTDEQVQWIRATEGEVAPAEAAGRVGCTVEYVYALRSGVARACPISDYAAEQPDGIDMAARGGRHEA